MNIRTAKFLKESRDDLAYHQMRVLILVTIVSSTKGHSAKIDGLTKLAKLDFLIRYPTLAPAVLDQMDPLDPRLHLELEQDLTPTDVEAPMIRFKYGPWDNRYYTIIGSLIGRGLVKYVKGRRGSVALSPTLTGKSIAHKAASSKYWQIVNDRCIAVAEASSGQSGTSLKDLIYARLPELMDRPHREIIT